MGAGPRRAVGAATGRHAVSRRCRAPCAAPIWPSRPPARSPAGRCGCPGGIVIGARRIALDVASGGARLVLDGDPGPPPYLMSPGPAGCPGRPATTGRSGSAPRSCSSSGSDCSERSASRIGGLVGPAEWPLEHASSRTSHPSRACDEGRCDRRHPIGNVLDAIGEPVRIAHLVPTLHPDGPEIGLVDLAQAAPQVGIDLVVIALASTSDTTQVSALRRLGVPVDELGLAPGTRGPCPGCRGCCGTGRPRCCTPTCRRPTSPGPRRPCAAGCRWCPRCTGWRTSRPTGSTGSSGPRGSWPASGS